MMGLKALKKVSWVYFKQQVNSCEIRKFIKRKSIFDAPQQNQGSLKVEYVEFLWKAIFFQK